MTDLEILRRAGRIAFVAMGTERVRFGRQIKTVHLADEDPLAWWTLTELIADLAIDAKGDRA